MIVPVWNRQSGKIHLNHKRSPVPTLCGMPLGNMRFDELDPKVPYPDNEWCSTCGAVAMLGFQNVNCV